MKIKYTFLLFLATLFLNSTFRNFEKVNDQHPIPFEPETYLCYKTNEALNIDGKLTEAIWHETEPTKDFVDIEGHLKPLPPYSTNVKMLWDDNYFYFGAYMQEPHIWAKLSERDAVIFYDNDFEIFIDPDGDTHSYYEFEVNALNTIWDLFLLRPYREDKIKKVLNNWDIRGVKSAVFIDGTLNNPSDTDNFWTVEIAIPWQVLKEMTPKKLMPKEGVQWRLNFSRVNWQMTTQDGTYQKQKDTKGEVIPAENWVWSPQGYINMHMPETWGFVQFSEIIAGQGKATFKHSEDEKIKWALRQLYYQQRRYFQQNKQYIGDLNALTLPEVMIENYEFQPQLYLGFLTYEITAVSADGQGLWVIQQDGKIYEVNRKEP